MKLIASTYYVVANVSNFIHSRNVEAEVLKFNMFDTEARTNAIKRIIIEMRNGPTPDFHEEIEKYFLEEESEGVLRVVKTSSGNVIVTGSAVDLGGDTLIMFGCDATRGRIHQDYPDLKQVFPNPLDWDHYESEGPIVRDWDGIFDKDLSILPWEDKADYLYRTRDTNNSYETEVRNALNVVVHSTYYSTYDIVESIQTGSFYSHDLKSYQVKLLQLHFKDRPERTTAAIRYAEAINPIVHQENCNLFA